jgi:hypothetical protein
MAGRPCIICSSSASAKTVAQMVSAGKSDKEIASAIGGVSRMSINRHRRLHLEAPAKALVEASNRGKDIRAAREKMVKAAEAGDPMAFFSVGELAADLKSTRDQLARVADNAEQSGQLAVIPLVAAQRHRNVELRARIGQVGAFAAAKVTPAEATVFSLTINFSDRPPEKIITTMAGPVIDALPNETQIEDDDVVEEDV